MSKPNDEKKQAETGLPYDGGRGGDIIHHDTEMPRINSHVVKTGAKEEKVGPDAGVNFREPYDEQHGGEENLHDRHVKVGEIDHTSTQKFEK